MTANDKGILTAQLNQLQSRVYAFQGQMATCRIVAAAPIPTPAGAVPVPALGQLCSLVDQLNDLSQQILKYLGLLIEKL
jgi:hypothetical protein